MRCAWRASMALSSARGRVGARSALGHLTHRRCLSGSEAQRNVSEFRRCDRPLSNTRESPQATAIVKHQGQCTQAFATRKEALRLQQKRWLDGVNRPQSTAVLQSSLIVLTAVDR